MNHMSMNLQQFTYRFKDDLSKFFSDVKISDRLLHVSSGDVEVNIPVTSIFSEYTFKGYKDTLKSYKQVFGEIVNSCKYRADYNNIFPVIYNTNIDCSQNLRFYKTHFCLDLDIFYCADMGNIFRFIQADDDIDIKKMKSISMENINRLTNVLIRLDDILDIWTLKFPTDYAGSLLLSTSIKKQISKMIGRDYIFAIPCTSTLIVAKPVQQYVRILKSLMGVTYGSEVSNRVYRCKNGIYEYADPACNLSVVK